MQYVALINEYLAGVDQLKAAVEGLTPEQRMAHPVPDKWSVHELVCHLADFEPVFADRMSRVIALENPTLIGADENAYFRSLAYEQRNFDEQVLLIEVTRMNMARILKAQPEVVFQRSGTHTEAGVLTLEALVKKAVWHMTHHLSFLPAKRQALGV